VRELRERLTEDLVGVFDDAGRLRSIECSVSTKQP
jgi:hypothetical protein